MVLPLTIFVSSLHTHSLPSVRVLAAAAIVTLGFLLGVAPIGNGSTFSSLNIARPSSSASAASINPSFISLVYGFLSSLFIALHSVLIKSSLPHCNNSTIQLAYWTNLGSAVIVLPGVFFHGEFSRVTSLMSVAEWDGRLFFWGCIITGVFGFLLCVAGLLSIKVTSPITHMFSSVSHLPFDYIFAFLCQWVAPVPFLTHNTVRRNTAAPQHVLALIHSFSSPHHVYSSIYLLSVLLTLELTIFHFIITLYHSNFTSPYPASSYHPRYAPFFRPLTGFVIRASDLALPYPALSLFAT